MAFEKVTVNCRDNGAISSTVAHSGCVSREESVITRREVTTEFIIRLDENTARALVTALSVWKGSGNELVSLYGDLQRIVGAK